MGGRIMTGSVNCSDITVNKDIITEYSNSNTAIADGTKELEVTVNRREYNIVGDELYIPKRYEDAPQWLRDIIDTVTSTSLSNALSDVSTLGDMLTGLIAELNVAKNTYAMSIISDNDINERINTAITTLNSSLADADSTILDVAMTRVTPEEAQTIALGILSASIAGGDIAATVQSLQSAITDVDNARALDYTRLNASISDEFESTATAISTINAYVGIDEAGASTGTGLSAYLEDSNGVIGGADSQLNNTIKATAEGIESKFEYNSIVNINGVYKKSGFGLTTNYTSGSGTEANPYVSEFWIDASRLKFTNSAMTGQTAPFTIDATGTTPQITFNGKVTFSNITGTATHTSGTSSPTLGATTAVEGSTYYNTSTKSGYIVSNGSWINNSSVTDTSGLALKDMSNVTSIDGGKIVTNEAFVNNLNAVGGVVADYVNANELNGLTINGGIINGARINGAVIKASYFDLNGELEVLTNYIITVAMYNANPSLYTDAVYISSDNQYRIPSLSTIKNKGSSTITEALHNTVRYMYISENIKSYNNANSGHNTKCVRIDPSFNILTSKLYYYSDKRFDIHSRNTGAATIYLCSFYVNSQEVAKCYHSVVAGGTYFIRILDVRRNVTYSSSSFSVSSSTSFNAVMLNGLDVSVSVSASTYDTSASDLPYGFTYSVFLNPCVVSSISNFTSGNLLYMSYYSYYHYGYAFGATQAFKTYAYNPASNITINNMI